MAKSRYSKLAAQACRERYEQWCRENPETVERIRREVESMFDEHGNLIPKKRTRKTRKHGAKALSGRSPSSAAKRPSGKIGQGRTP